MDERTNEFVTSFQAFLDEVVYAQRRNRGDGPSLVAVLTEHLGTDPRGLPVVTEEIPAHLFVDLDVALAEVQDAAPEHRLLGVGGGQQRRHNSLSEILENAERHGNFPVGAVDYRSIATGPDTVRQAISFGLRLFTFDGAPVAVLQRTAEPRFGQTTAQMEILTAAGDVAAALIAAVRDLMLRRSVLRGQVLSLGGSDYEPGVGRIVFHRRPALTADQIILPPGVLDRIGRHVAGVATHRDRLRAAGQHLKRGLLLYGPPGTGKTHTVRYLLGALPEVTVILLAGPSIAYVAEATQMARALQPALVVLEDCDLVAESRDHHAGPQPLLFAVLEALDGLADDADVAFLLTTNRVDILEPALAQRPGRVDLAVEVPLPDAEARRRLIELYARGLPFGAATLDRAAGRSAGITASFAKELVRRAVLVAAESGHQPGDADLERALDEMLAEGESITRSLLGSHG
ncbi:AAA family ATPase [Actinoplanes aureus]|uniref:ATP-binding protein n=1 Tax=Actinoplanes aureus TaxID=2792083 RepID=A0A931CEW9_9ACTN|nr:ATP-binding protein [Actinoplanes aureus]MBG0567319.1 ATP-binding protein [Actinoplanes aureus]